MQLLGNTDDMHSDGMRRERREVVQMMTKAIAESAVVELCQDLS